MTATRYQSPEGRLKAIRLHPFHWRFGYEDRGDWISLEQSSYHVGPVEIVVSRDTFITSRPNWRRGDKRVAGLNHEPRERKVA